MIFTMTEFDNNQLFWPTSRYNQREPSLLFAFFLLLLLFKKLLELL